LQEKYQVASQTGTYRLSVTTCTKKYTKKKYNIKINSKTRKESMKILFITSKKKTRGSLVARAPREANPTPKIKQISGKSPPSTASKKKKKKKKKGPLPPGGYGESGK
jgi:hypothetical protein